MNQQEYLGIYIDNQDWWKNVPNLRKSRIAYKLGSVWVDFLEWAIPMLDRIYPNRYDIQLEVNINLFNGEIEPLRLRRSITGITPHIIIHFPHFIVKNSNNQQMEIHDMYVKIKMQLSSLGDVWIGNMEGLRQTYTKREVLVNYKFSHLASGSPLYPPKYSNFCTGSGEIVQVQALFNAHREQPMFELYLYCIEQYLQWESLEGNPYISMSTVLNYKRRRPHTPTPSYCEYFYQRTLPYLQQVKENIPLTLSLKNGNIVLFPDEKFHTMLIDVLNKYYDLFLNQDTGVTESLLFTFENGVYTPLSEYTDLSNTRITVSEVPFIFKGEKRYYKILPEPLERVDRDTRKRFINPIIANYVKARLEQQCAATILTGYAYKRLRNTSHPFEGGRRSDTLSVRTNQ